MKRGVLVSISSVLAFLFLSCAMPQNPILKGDVEIPEVSAGTQTMFIETDLSRNQGIFVDEKGVRVDIRSEEEGIVVNCVRAIDLAVLNDEGPTAKGFDSHDSAKALVVGVREDGKPGVWMILKDNKVSTIWNEEGTRNSSCLWEAYRHPGRFHVPFGWVYEVEGIVKGAGDWWIVLGLARNPDGFKLGGPQRWKIEPGTQVAVYWKIWKAHRRPFIRISRAMVIGIEAEGDRPHPPRRKFPLLSDFESYLISYETEQQKEPHYDPDADVYVVYGQNELEKDAEATISKDDIITITEIGTGNGGEVDLVPGRMSWAEDGVQSGSTLNLTLPVKNTASGTLTTDFSIHFYLSLAAPLAADRDLGAKTFSAAIAGNSTVEFSTSLLIPDLGSVNRCVFIYALLDSAGQVVELDEANNQSTIATAACVLYGDGTGTYDIIIETVPPTGAGGVNPDTEMFLYAAGGNWLASDNDGGGVAFYSKIARVGPQALASGTYYIGVWGYNAPGPFALSVRTSNVAIGDIRYFDQELADNSQDAEEDVNLDPDTYPGTFPATLVQIKAGDTSNRYLGVYGSDNGDWFKLVLP